MELDNVCTGLLSKERVRVYHYLIKQYIGHFEAQSLSQYRPFSGNLWNLLFGPLIRTLGNQAILNEVSNFFGGTENENIRKNLKFTQFHIDKNACPLGNVLNLLTNHNVRNWLRIKNYHVISYIKLYWNQTVCCAWCHWNRFCKVWHRIVIIFKERFDEVHYLLTMGVKNKTFCLLEKFLMKC